MLQELAANTGATAWAIASMFFFLAVWLAVVVWVFRARAEDFEARARLALEGDGDPGSKDPGLRSASRADGNARRSAGSSGQA